VSGLLRISEPGGGFLRKNDPAGEHWYSRDVQAIAAARGLSHARVAPFFIDAEADAAKGPGAQSRPGEETPVGGLTVITFHNSHLVYALTWYALALMVAGAGVWLVRDERKLQRQAG
jgi:surfeit locus 1 family protein